MVVRKARKSRKLRGRTRTMGWGRIGQHRKSGSRGGFGAVGLHKHKAVWMIKYAPDWYGKHGFKSVKQVRKYKYYRAINIGEIEEIARKMITSNTATREDNLIVVDTVKMGYDKVLGGGKVTMPLKIIARSISEEARKKIQESGGVVVLQSSE